MSKRNQIYRKQSDKMAVALVRSEHCIAGTRSKNCNFLLLSFFKRLETIIRFRDF